MTDTITISKETAEIIAQAFLPANPNKLRKPHVSPEYLAALKTACHEFRQALRKEG